MSAVNKDIFKQRVSKKKAKDLLIPAPKEEIKNKSDIENENQINTKIVNTNESVSTNENNSKNANKNNEEGKLERIASKYIIEDDIEERFESKYQQQNVYIERKVIKEITGILKEEKKKGRKLSKKDIYNNALKMYLEIVHDTTVD